MKKEKNSIQHLLHLIWPAKKYLLACTCALMTVIFVNTSTPLFSQIFVDSILTNKHPEWHKPMLLIYALTVLMCLVGQVAKACYSQRLLIHYRVYLGVRYFWHTLRLPMSFFGQHYAADLVSRYKRAVSAGDELTWRLFQNLGLVLQVVVMVIFMVVYSPLLSLLCLFSIICNVVAIQIVARLKRKACTRVEMSYTSLVSESMAIISNIEAIQAAGADDDFFKRWHGKYANALNSSVYLYNLDTRAGFVPDLLEFITSLLALCVGASLVIDGELTAGMLLAFQGFLNQFLSPIRQFTKLVQAFINAAPAAKRYDEVMEAECDVESEIDASDGEELEKLRGEVEICNVTFGYDKEAEPLIRNFSLKVEAGKSVALVGGSGSGKSTIANMVTGLYRPWEGEVLFDGKPKKDINRYVFHDSIAVVNQDIILFDGTIDKNISMWDNTTSNQAIKEAAKMAEIHDVIAARPNGYNDMVTNGGSNFSGGQRQRIEIATALAKNPSVIILDEATSALDPLTEANVMKNIREKGITMIIVAHRLSTIRDCDEIIVLNRGVVEDRGTHEHLMKNTSGLYYKLMQMN